MRDYESLLKTAHKAQLEKLQQNDHKPGFDKIDLQWAYTRLIQEVEELEQELNAPIWIDLDSVSMECADIANFAAMIIKYCEDNK